MVSSSPVRRFGVLVAIAVAWPTSAHAGKVRAFETPIELLLAQARGARRMAEYDAATRLLSEAQTLAGADAPEILLERGLLARDLDQPEEALALLRKAADLDADSTARVDQAGVLVKLGRWPEAVVTLRQAFDERAGALSARDIMSDQRFVRLLGFAPYEELLDGVRSDESGLYGKLRRNLRHIETSTRNTEDGLDRFWLWLDPAAALLSQTWVAVVALIVLCLMLAAGSAQTGVVAAPWTLLVGFAGGAGVWYAAALQLTGNAKAGLMTIGYSAAVLFVPTLIGVLVRLRRVRRRGTQIPPAA